MRSASRLHPVHDRGIDQPVVEHDVGLLHQAKGAEGQQVRVARPGADQIDLADRMLVGGRAVGPAIGDFAVEQGLRAGFVARQHHFGDRAVIDALPEAQPRLMAGELAGERGAARAGKLRQPAIGRRNQRFQPCLEHPPEQRRVAAGGNRHHQRAAVEHRGDDEVADAGMVGDIDQSPAGPGAGDQRQVRGLLGLVAGLEGEIGEGKAEKGVALVEIAEAILAAQSFEFVAPGGGEQPDLGAGAGQGLHAPRGERAAADDGDAALVEVEKERQAVHRESGVLGSTGAHGWRPVSTG